MPSIGAAADAIAFAPTAQILEDAIASLTRDGERGGGAVDAAVRREALARYAELPVPGTKPGRTWRHDYTKLRFDDLTWSSRRGTLPTAPVRPADVVQSADVMLSLSKHDQPALATENAGGLVHLGATYLAAPQGAAADPRAVVVPLADALREHGAVLAGVHGAIVDWRNDKFAALATAFQNCGAFVYVPDGVVLDAPIQLLFSNVEPQTEAVFPQIVVVLGAGARATVLERHVGEGEPLICGTVEAQVGTGAQLDYVVVQQAGESARLFMHRGARCGRDATVRWHLADLGGTLARSVIDARLDGEGSHGETAAFFFNTGAQHVDLTTTTDHAVGNTTSEVVVRTAATDRGQGRYFGNILIRPKAHGSDASLRDDALLLSKRAHIDSVPALEIAANDVRAFHGATVGSLDEEALFYAQSRGIARADAMRMIALAFFEPAIARFPSEALRDEVRTALDQKLDDATEIDG
ncbi:MAG TPA: Fe-S cluster assembly protein SufD [Candidatus Limnocylindria bacterium]|nr:Fe-S cluster assembly protein SufD [Candidatus Limnocylindria bacterium]